MGYWIVASNGCSARFSSTGISFWVHQLVGPYVMYCWKYWQWSTGSLPLGQKGDVDFCWKKPYSSISRTVELTKHSSWIYMPKSSFTLLSIFISTLNDFCFKIFVNRWKVDVTSFWWHLKRWQVMGDAKHSHWRCEWWVLQCGRFLINLSVATKGKVNWWFPLL